MKREIKFRVWSAETSDENGIPAFQMIDADSLVIASQDLLKKELKESEYFKLMQFTGLTDINGNEIYEGDVVRYDGLNETKHTATIVFGKYGWSLKSNFIPTLGIDQFNSSVPKSFEVIGNIYEHNELLK